MQNPKGKYTTAAPLVTEECTEIPPPPHYIILTISMATKQAKVVFQSPLAVAEALPTKTL